MPPKVLLDQFDLREDRAGEFELVDAVFATAGKRPIGTDVQDEVLHSPVARNLVVPTIRSTLPSACSFPNT